MSSHDLVVKGHASNNKADKVRVNSIIAKSIWQAMDSMIPESPQSLHTKGHAYVNNKELKDSERALQML